MTLQWPTHAPIDIDPTQAACNTPEGRLAVDATYGTNGPAARQAADTVTDTLCRHCPLQQDCRDWAMSNHEWGVWGGTTQKQRTKRGAPRARTPARDR